MLVNYLDLLLFLIYIVYYTPYLNYNRIIAMRFVKQKIIDKAKQNYLQNLFFLFIKCTNIFIRKITQELSFHS